MKTARRNGIVDFMRFIFCVVIVFCHGRNLGGGSEKALFADAGYIGVEFFFLVSGFLMAKSALSAPDSGRGLGSETLTFMWRKIRAVLPYYLFAVLFSYGTKAYINEYSFVETVRNFLLGIWDLMFLRAAGFRSFGLIRATWYLSAMFSAMFILYPILRKYGRTFTRVIAPLLAIFLTGYLTQTCSSLDQHINNWNFVYTGLIRAVAEISLGCVCYEIVDRMKGVQYTVFSRVLITLGQVVGYGFILYCMNDLPDGKQFDFVLLPIMAFCVVLSFSGQGVAVRLFTGRPFPWLGKMSMIVYLNHMWVKDTLAALMPESLGYFKLLGIFLACTVAASLVCLFFVDGVGKLIDRNRDKIRRCFIKQ